MASQKHHKAFMDALNGKEAPIGTAPQEVVSHRSRRFLTPLLAFSDVDIPPEGATHTRPLQITIE